MKHQLFYNYLPIGRCYFNLGHPKLKMMFRTQKYMLLIINYSYFATNLKLLGAARQTKKIQFNILTSVRRKYWLTKEWFLLPPKYPRISELLGCHCSWTGLCPKAGLSHCESVWFAQNGSQRGPPSLLMVGEADSRDGEGAELRMFRDLLTCPALCSTVHIGF